MKKAKIIAALSIVLCAALFVSWIKPKASANWKLGIALWTFHRFTLAESICKSDSAGVHYIEGSTFQKVGDEIENASASQISDQGIVKLNKYLDDHHLQMKSIYVFGGKTIASWKSGFELAKRLKERADKISPQPPDSG